MSYVKTLFSYFCHGFINFNIFNLNFNPYKAVPQPNDKAQKLNV